MKTNSFVALIIAILLLFQLSGDAVLRLWHQLGNESFTEVFCENIDEPQLECKGSCFIGDQLDNNFNESLPFQNLLTPPSSLEAFLLPPAFNFVNHSSLLHLKRLNQYSFVSKEWNLASPQPPPEV